MIRARTVVATASVLVVSCGLGCKKPGPPPPPPDPMAVPKEVGEVRLATSTSTTAPTEGFSVYVSRESVFADKPPKKLFALPQGADAARGIAEAHKRSGPHDLFLVPLAEASPTSVGHAIVYFDRETPYRIVTEVVFTLGQRSVPRMELAVTGKDGGTKMIEVFTPRACRPSGAQLKKMEEDMKAVLFALGSASAPASTPAPPPAPAPSSTTAQLPECRETMGFTVLVVGEGISIKARGGNVAPGCNDVGPGLALPKSRSNAYDLEGLTRCLERLKHVSSESEAEEEITFVANPNIPFEALVGAIDAARRSPEGGVLFPKAKLGLAR